MDSTGRSPTEMPIQTPRTVTCGSCMNGNRLFNFLACQVLYDQCIDNPAATVVDVKSKSNSKWRPVALDTVELEKLSSRKLKINAKETMKIAEKLYTQGFISYPRTETNMFPKDLDLISLVEEQTRDPEWGEKGELLFIQFPDTLPGLPASVPSDDRSRPSTSSASVQEDELVTRLGSCQLKDCTEGYMDKLRVYKSGKAELLLGDNVMEVLPGIPINFHQELVSIHTDDSPGQMIVLGPVSHKLVITPDYSNLLSHVNKYC